VFAYLLRIKTIRRDFFSSIAGALVQQPSNVVDCTWGSSSDWVLQLCDRKRLSIPLLLLRPPDPDGSGDADHLLMGWVNWTQQG
jgi:hypothetical protein